MPVDGRVLATEAHRCKTGGGQMYPARYRSRELVVRMRLLLIKGRYDGDTWTFV
jgi:hypothetical protein